MIGPTLLQHRLLFLLFAFTFFLTGVSPRHSDLTLLSLRRMMFSVETSLLFSLFDCSPK